MSDPFQVEIERIARGFGWDAREDLSTWIEDQLTDKALYRAALVYYGHIDLGNCQLIEEEPESNVIQFPVNPEEYKRGDQ